MSPLQKVIQGEAEINPQITCKNCEQVFDEKNKLRKHMKDQHPSFKPCKNYPECSYGDQCDFYHIIMDENTLICWECGQIFSEKSALMMHRKTSHKTTHIVA